MAIPLLARHFPNTSSSSDAPGGRKCKYSGQSVRAIPMRVITVGKKRDRGIQLIVDEYTEKLSDVEAQIEDEDVAVTNLIKSDDWVVIMDEGGIDVSSEKLAELIGDAGMTGASRLLFCVGGPYGHGRQLRHRANLSVKLSSLVLNHQIALVVLMEQLYRAWTILKGQKYHH